jgi:hypothetical protein
MELGGANSCTQFHHWDPGGASLAHEFARSIKAVL